VIDTAGALQNSVGTITVAEMRTQVATAYATLGKQPSTLPFFEHHWCFSQTSIVEWP